MKHWVQRDDMGATYLHLKPHTLAERNVLIDWLVAHRAYVPPTHVLMADGADIRLPRETTRLHP